jgi:23S rRNA pseudouridine1911/1915/1917 synthase
MSNAETAPPSSVHRVAASADQAGERLDRFLAAAVGAALPGLSRSRVKALIAGGQVRAGAATITEPSHRVKPGTVYEIRLPPAEEPLPRGQKLPLDVVYEDAHLIVVDKPAGMVVHPAPGNPDRTLVNALIAHCGGSVAGIGGVRRPGIVHRLDKDTSGLIVAAKTDAAHAGLTAQFAGRRIERAYAAVVWGVPAPARGEIAGNIGRDPRHRKRMAVLARGGKPALTRYRVERALASGAAALLDCRLATGRTHQIRVHLAHIGHPLIGDPVYAGRFRRRARTLPEAAGAAIAAFARQALHARLLGFVHPVTGQKLRFESPLPADLRELIAALATKAPQS